MRLFMVGDNVNIGNDKFLLLKLVIVWLCWCCCWFCGWFSSNNGGGELHIDWMEDERIGVLNIYLDGE